MNYRKDIDGLRAFAVVAVILNHLNKDILPGGFLGVDIFFVISGFVITSSLLKNDLKKPKEVLADFYIKRIRRILPALLVFILIGSFLIVLVNANPLRSLQLGIASIFGVSNMYLIASSSDYFAPSTEYLAFTNTWSLGVEEQFYFVYPFLLILLRRIIGDRNNYQKSLLMILLGLSFLSFVSFTFLYSNNINLAYYLMPTRFWEIAIGCIAFLFYQKNDESNVKFKAVSKLSVFVGISIIALLFIDIGNLAPVQHLAIVFLTSIVLVFANQLSYAKKALSSEPIVFAGKISYSLYLYHWLVICISRWTIGIQWWSIPFQLLLIFSLSLLSFKYIETPFRNKIGKNLKRFNYFISSFVTTLASLLVVQSLIFFTRWSQMLFIPQYFVNNFTSKWGEIKCFDILDKRIKCTNLSHSSSKKRIIVIGDSHAQQYFFMLDKALSNNFNVGYYANTSAFKYLWGEEASPSPELVSMLEYVNPGDVIVISFVQYLMNSEFGIDTPTHLSLNQPVPQTNRISRSQKNLSNLINVIHQKGGKVLIIRDSPMLKTENVQISTCLIQDELNLENSCDVSVLQAMHSRKAQDLVFDRVIEDSRKNKIEVLDWDPINHFPTKDSNFTYSEEGKIIMIDQHHISQKYSEKLSARFLEFWNSL